MRNGFLRLTLLGLASASLASACVADQPGGEPEAVAPDGARILRAGSGALTAPSNAELPQIVRGFLRDRGAGLAVDQLRVSSQTIARSGIKHVRFEQEIDGLRVHGAYVKAAISDSGEILQVIERVALPTGAMVKATVRDQDALVAALAELGYEAAVPAKTRAQGTRSSFARGGVFHRDPSVERVAYADEAGALREGFLVETWSARGNQLDHTLVDGSGKIVSVERRTNNDSYNVFIEDPLKGAQTVVSGGVTAESPAGWLGTGSQLTTNISGNNAHAYLDTDANNAPDSSGTAVTNGDFLAAADLARDPSTTGNRAVAVQNLFYLNNVVHDVLYQHGFDEAAGNFQINNFGKGGAGNDAVNAEAQDGSGTDNANFSTPADGSAPRMQMYLWTGTTPDSLVTVSGADVGAYSASFGPALTTTGVSGAIALYNDGTGTATDACEASRASLTGKVALIDRGSCDFTVKVMNAQGAGAIGVIVANNTGGDTAFSMGGTERRVRIPAVMVSQNNGSALRLQLGATAQVHKSSVPPLKLDGDMDSDIVFHEYGHGLTWRMIGGMSGPLAGAIGEGASDTVAFLLNGDDRIGEYAYGTPAGIRRNPYAGYPRTYADVTGAEVHDDGEIYAAAMYRVLENYLAAGLTADTVLSDFVEGMNFTPATPAYENMRDGMLQATAGTGRECLIWRAFAQTGIGVGAVGAVSRRGAVTITASFTVPVTCR
jgi:extracellular elastinolytic metalloproteinase